MPSSYKFSGIKKALEAGPFVDEVSARDVGHPTREKLIEVVTTMLEHRRMQDITSDDVLTASGVSRGSLYHHFEDFPELLEVAMVRRFSAFVDLSISEARDAVQSAASREELAEALRKITRRVNSPSVRTIRSYRVQLLAMSAGNRRLSLVLAQEQQRLTDAIADQFLAAQRKGLMAPSFDPMAAAVFIQAYVLGRILDDVAERHVEEAQWNALVARALTGAFGIDLAG